MKYSLFFCTLIFFSYTINSQIKVPIENIVVIGNLENGKVINEDYMLSDLKIKSKIKKAFKIDLNELKFTNPVIKNEKGKGWFLQYSYHTPLYLGLYKEELQIKNNQLVITESRNVILVLATNCNKLKFIDSKNRSCICTDKKEENEKSIIKERFFFSAR